MKKLLKIFSKYAIYIVPCICLAIAFYMRIEAKSIGQSMGQTAGSSVGKMMGSLEAFTDHREAYAEGKAEGLSAKDTTAAMGNQVRELQKLEVLVAGVKLKDEHSVGDQDYAALYLLKGDAVFTVDFSKADIQQEGDTLSITLPEPEMELIVDQEKLEKVEEYQDFFWSGSAEDGYDAYLASMKNVVEKAEEKLGNYDILMASAKESAERQVRQLIQAVSVSEVNVEIVFGNAEKGIQNAGLETEMTEKANTENETEMNNEEDEDYEPDQTNG